MVHIIDEETPNNKPRTDDIVVGCSVEVEDCL